MNNNHWHSNREKIYGWMVANDLKSYAELYKGAVENLEVSTIGLGGMSAFQIRNSEF